MKKRVSGAIPLAAPHSHQSEGVDLDLEVDEARSQGRRHAVGDAAVALAVAAGDERGALGELVLAALTIENELVQRGLDHGRRGRELLEVDEEPLVGVRGGQERRGRPAGALVEQLGDRLVALDDGGHVGGDALVAALLQDDLDQHALQHVQRAPGDAAQIHGVEQQCAHVDVEAPEGRGDLPDDVALGGAGRAPDHDRLPGFDKDLEGGGELARPKRVVGGDGVGVGHGRLLNAGETARTSPDVRGLAPAKRHVLRALRSNWRAG